MAVNYRYGDIVLVKFSFGLHPAYVIYDNGDQDVVVLMITSNKSGESEEIEIPQGEGNIKNTSYIRTHKVATVSKKVVGSAIIGRVSDAFAKDVASKISTWLPLS